jgi:hypothetical protein
MNRKLLIAGLVVAIIVVIAIVWNQNGGCLTTGMCPTGQTCQARRCTRPPAPPPPPPPPVKPRWPKVSDCGYPDHIYGWFDAQAQGAKNDYCRWVGNDTATEKPYFACALAGSTDAYTAPGRFDAAKMASGCDAGPSGGCPGGGCGLRTSW